MDKQIIDEADDYERRLKLCKRNIRRKLKKMGLLEWLRASNEVWQLSVYDIQREAREAVRYGIFNGVIITKQIERQIKKDEQRLFGFPAEFDWSAFNTEYAKLVAKEIHDKRTSKPKWIKWHSDKINRRRRERYAERKADNA